MKINFHYYCIKALAVEAGLSDKEAQLVAYASQHVDDAVEHTNLRINGCLYGRPYKRVCSAHKSLWKLRRVVNKPETWFKVFIPFHFIPPVAYKPRGGFSYRARKNSPWIRCLLREALKRCKSKDERERALVRLGILLHVYADTWSHADFSGVGSVEDNAVIEFDPNTDDGNPPVIFDMPDGVIPAVGHGQAFHFPDQSSRNWQVLLGERNKRRISRNNPQQSLGAAERIYALLCGLTGKKKKWAGLAGRIRKCLVESTECDPRSLRIWSKTFRDTEFRYDESEWQKKAIRKTGRVQPRRKRAKKTYTAIDNYSPWFYFHEEARAHRQEVVKGLPPKARRQLRG